MNVQTLWSSTGEYYSRSFATMFLFGFVRIRGLESVHSPPVQEVPTSDARRGVFHMDNHTNNRLERYHHTIKTVLRSSQVNVG